MTREPSIKVGQTYESKHGTVEVIEYIRSSKIKIRFQGSGYETYVQGNKLLNNVAIKDKLSPTVCGVGIVGELRKRGVKRYYVCWRSMLARCYDPNIHKRQPTYIGCTVSERWLTLSNFIEDVKLLPNYDKWIAGEDFDLDKDSRVKGNRHYSLETCMFIRAEDNGKESRARKLGRI